MQNSNLSGRALLAAVDLVTLAESYGVSTKKDKGEYVGLCPFHNDTNPSLWINNRKSPNVFTCRACGQGGSVLDFVIQAENLRGNNVDTAGAFKIIEGGLAGGEIPRSLQVDSPTVSDWTLISPVPADAPAPYFSHPKLGLATRSWAYHNAAGSLIGYVARFDFADGRKDVLPYSYCEREGRRFWSWRGQEVPRSLYGLDLLAKYPGLPILVVEGEKTADAANKLFSGVLVAVSWPGGSRSVRFADWSPLADRNVLLWPDADLPGFQAMFGFWKWKEGQADPAEWKDGVSQLIEAAGARQVKAVRISPELPEGWDLADGVRDGWDKVSAIAYLREHTLPAPIRPEAPGVSAPTGAPEEAPKELVPDKPQKPAKAKKTPTVTFSVDKREPEGEEEPLGLPFRPLGYRKNASSQNEFWIYSYKAKQALCFAASKFTKSALLQLEDEWYWEERFSDGKAGYETKAAEYLMNLCYKKYFNPETVRGIGAWLDEGRVVIHAGTHIVAEGKEHPLQSFGSEFLYEANRPFGFKVVPGLSSKEAAKFLEAAKLLNWERPAFAELFIGWCVLAPICGALHWRPHIWVTGPAGSGKTTAMDHLKKLVGNIILPAQGNTTEAAIRQSLGQDARPVSFDEADSDGYSDTTRLQTILSLVRAASSHDGGNIIKGGSNGQAQSFVIRSCFAFSSITPKTATAADKGRVTVLSLVAPPVLVKSVAEENWAKIETVLHECFTPERCEALRARTLNLLPELLQNAAVFKRAATVVLGESRAGDQFGTLLAGAYSLMRSDVVSFEDAKKYVAERNWDELRNEETDEVMLLGKIMEQPVRVKSSGGVEHERTVGELIIIASEGAKAGEVVDKDSARDRVGRIGIRVEADCFYISNTADWLQKTLRGTAWATNHGQVLTRLAGAERVKSTYFGPGVKNSRSVKLPISILKE